MGALIKIIGVDTEVIIDDRNLVEKRAKPIAQIDKEGNVIRIFNSISEAERITGIAHIRECANGCLYRKSAGGYRWKIVEEI